MFRLMTLFLLIMIMFQGANVHTQEDLDQPGYLLAYSDGCNITLITVPSIVISTVPSITGDCDGPGVFLDEETDLIFFDYGTYITGGYRNTPWGQFLSERFRIGHPIAVSEDTQQVVAFYNTFEHEDTHDSDGLVDTFSIEIFRRDDLIGIDTEAADFDLSLILHWPLTQVWLPDGKTLVLPARETIDGPDVIALVDTSSGEVTWLDEDRYISPTRYESIFGGQQLRVWEDGYARLYTIDEDEQPYAWSSTLSPDGRWLAFWVQDQSSGIHVLHLYDTEAGADREIANTLDANPPTVPYWLMPPTEDDSNRAD